MSIDIAYDLALAAYKLCQEASAAKAVLKQVEQKIRLVVSVLQSLPRGSVQRVAVQPIVEGVQKLHHTVTKARNMKRVVYLVKAESIRSLLREDTENLKFYLLSLTVNQNSTIYKKIHVMEGNWGKASKRDDDEMRKQQQKEEKEAAELRRIVATQEEQLSQTDMECRGLIERQADLQDVIRELLAEQSRLRKDQNCTKAEMEAVYMEQIVNFLQNVKDTPLANTPVWPDFAICPITDELMLDPILVDGVNCQCTVSRQAFTEWVETRGHKTCPVDGGPLRSSRILPNARLADSIRYWVQEQSDRNTGHVPMAMDSNSLTPVRPPDSAVPTALRPTNDHASLSSVPTTQTSTVRPLQPAKTNSRATLSSQPTQPIAYHTTVFPKSWMYSSTQNLEGHSMMVRCCDVLDGGDKALSGSYDGTLKVWDVNMGNCLHTLQGHSDWVTCCAVLDGGHKVLTGSRDKTLKVWDVNTGNCLHTLQGHSDLVTCCAVLDGGHKVLTGSSDKTLKVWDMGTGNCLKTLKGHSDRVTCCASLDGGRKVLTGSIDKTLKVWDLGTGNCLQTLQGHCNKVYCCAVLVGGHKVLSGSHDRTLKVWDVGTGKCLQTLKGHSRLVTCCAVLDGGHKVLSGSHDHTLKVWDVGTGNCLQTLKGHSSGVICCAGLDSGHKVLTGSSDTTLKVWELHHKPCRPGLGW